MAGRPKGVAQCSGARSATVDPGEVRVVQPEESFQLLYGRLTHPKEATMRCSLLISPVLPNLSSVPVRGSPSSFCTRGTPVHNRTVATPF